MIRYAQLLVLLGLVGSGYWWGHTATDNAWAARQAKASQQAASELEKANARADGAAGNYLREHLEQEERYDQLSVTYHALLGRVPLVVPRPVAVVVAPAQHGHPQPQPHAGVAADPAVHIGPGLTVAAVRMWNDALTGDSEATSACSAAGATQESQAACAEDSGIALDDAWANHFENAKSCAQDRKRYQHLIDFLTQDAQP